MGTVGLRLSRTFGCCHPGCAPPPPRCRGGLSRKNGGFRSGFFGIVDRSAFTWAIISFPFLANSVPKRSGAASLKYVSSLTTGRRALLILHIILSLRRCDIWALAFPISPVASFRLGCYHNSAYLTSLYWII